MNNILPITTPKKIEELENFLNIIIENVPDIIFVKEVKELRFVGLNKAAEEFFRLTKEEIIGKNYYDLYAKKYADFYTAFDKQVLTTKETLDLPEEKIHTKDRGERILHTKKIPIFDTQGNLMYLLVIASDITASKKILFAMEQERAKDEFLSIAAHQLRTPLGTMRWQLERLLKLKLSNHLKKTMLEMYQSNLQLIALVNGLLDVSRINQNQVQNNPELTNIVVLLEEIVQQFEGEAKTNVLHIDMVIRYTPKHVMIDPRLFRQVIQNILSNAIKYNKKHGSITVTLTKSEGSILIKIADTGVGIAPEDIKKVFGKFYRAESATKIGIDGTGLGLYVVRSFVKYWKGKAWIESKEGEGTTVFVTIPLL